MKSPATIARQERVLNGLRSLSARQKPGQSFNNRTIAKVCGIDERAAEDMFRSALRQAGRALVCRHATLFQELTNVSGEVVLSRLDEIQCFRAARGKRKLPAPRS
jgi:hypothetical protein